MRFAISLPQFVSNGRFDRHAMSSYLARAEAHGFESAWTIEQILGTAPLLGPAETLAFAAAHTERIRLGCAAFVTPLHNPVHLAKTIGTLDQLSGGRIEFAVAIGGPGRAFSAFGVEPEHLAARFTEGLQFLTALMTDTGGGGVDFEGRFWQLRNGAMEPKPMQQPHPPMWFGANHPTALRRAVKLGYGFFGAGSTTTARFAEQVPVVLDALREQGRDRSDFQIAKRVYIGVDDDVERARQKMSAALDSMYGGFGLKDILQVAVYGPPETCIAGVKAIAAAGAELIMLNPLYDDAAQMERLVSDVMPFV
jgi:alkanesulfonate monooxygenase SsuD/methylene tetrahydromethanopterin reductase-like flavin-dependent oxidoreductase (luciferase family)